MSDPASLPVTNAEAAKAKLKAHDNAIRASGIAEGRRLQAQEEAQERNKLAALHKGQLAGMTEAHANELSRQRAQHDREEAKHGAWRFWKGLAVGGLVWGIIAGAATYAVIDNGQKAAFDAATEATSRGVIVDRASRAVDTGAQESPRLEAPAP